MLFAVAQIGEIRGGMGTCLLADLAICLLHVVFAFFRNSGPESREPCITMSDIGLQHAANVCAHAPYFGSSPSVLCRDTYNVFFALVIDMARFSCEASKRVIFSGLCTDFFVCSATIRT